MRGNFDLAVSEFSFECNFDDAADRSALTPRFLFEFSMRRAV
jgi:hypothetical protein